MKRASGFTLVELIVVIVLMGIVAMISTGVVTYSAQGAWTRQLGNNGPLPSP